MLTIDHLEIKYIDFHKAYNLQVKEGDTVLVVGVSGIGKSSLLLAIAGLIKPVAGDIRWHHQSIVSKPIEQRPVALQFQDYNLFEHITLEQNMRLATRLFSNEALLQHAEHLNIAQHWKKMPNQLSGGQRQRAALLRTMHRDEPIILLDEPFAQLDRDTHHLCRQWVQQQAKRHQKTVMMVSHHPSDELIADCVIEI